MNYVPLGKSGLKVSEICLGTMTFGNEADKEVSFKIMDYAYDIGINFFDTAHNYNKGETEKIKKGLLPDGEASKLTEENKKILDSLNIAFMNYHLTT